MVTRRRIGRLGALLLACAALAAPDIVRAQERIPMLDLTAAAPDRYAIVIGNADYHSAPDLKNARADAEIVADFLAGEGYQVAEYHDLTKLGFDVGTADGVAGPKTHEAIKAFERATGMSEVGAINPRLLAVLGSQPV